MHTHIRHIDYQGRISIPSTIRAQLNLEPEDKLEIISKGNKIIIQPAEPKCIICGNPTDNIYKKQYVCKDCVAGLTNDFNRSES